MGHTQPPSSSGLPKVWQKSTINIDHSTVSKYFYVQFASFFTLSLEKYKISTLRKRSTQILVGGNTRSRQNLQRRRDLTKPKHTQKSLISRCKKLTALLVLLMMSARMHTFCAFHGLWPTKTSFCRLRYTSEGPGQVFFRAMFLRHTCHEHDHF